MFKFSKTTLSLFFASFVGMLATLITIYAFFSTELRNSFGQNSNDIQVVKSVFYPNYAFFDNNSFKDVVELRLSVRNFSDRVIKLTSAKAQIKQARNLEFTTIRIGGSSLGENPVKNKPFILQPGETREVVFSGGLKLEGINDFLENNHFEKEHHFSSENFYNISNLEWVSLLNKEFSSKYGENATISVSLFEKYNILIKKVDIKLSEGKDIFSQTGALQHDIFLGTILAMYDGEVPSYQGIK